MSELNVDDIARNILVLLQQDPLRYRNFGIWWWPVKAILKAKGYTQEHLTLLGNYFDPEAVGRTPDLGLQEMLRSALEEYTLNARYNLGRTEVLDPHGAPYVIFDNDAPA